jgi:hypothetical protein
MVPTKKELILAMVVMLALPVVAELALRLVRIQFDPQLYIADQRRGWALRAGAEGIVTSETKQYVRINDLGFRDANRSYEKPQNTIRIAVLGNSWTEALQVPINKTYCSLLEHKLTELGCFSGKNTEVLNFGVSGYSTAQELITLREEVWKYSPDIIVVAFYSARDIANNVRTLNNAADPEQSPYFIFSGNSLVLDDSFRSLPAVRKRQIMIQRVRAEVNEHIRVLQGINALVRRGRVLVATAAIKERARREGGVDTLEHSIYAPPTQPALQEAWRVTEGLIIAIRDEVSSHGAQLHIVTLPNRPQVIPDLAKRLAFMRALGVPDLSYADRRINALGIREGISVTNLAPLLSEYARVHQVYLNGFDETNLGGGHWNEIGHQLAAETIAASICESPKKTTSLALTGAR